MTTAVAAQSRMISNDQWLSDLFGYSVFHLHVDSNEGPKASEIRDHFEQHNRAFSYAKIDVACTETLRELQTVGFNVVDTNVVFSLNDGAKESPALNTEQLVISEATNDDHADVLQIAGSCFRQSRFHLDPSVPNNLANKIKREWIKNCLAANRGDRVFVSRERGQVTGFLASGLTRDSNQTTAIIDLIGVGSAFQGRGIGMALCKAFIKNYSAKVDQLLVGTQIANLPSMRLYQKLGFNIIRSSYVLHKHVDFET